MKHTAHSGYSIIVRLKKDRTDIVRKLLSELNKDPGNNAKIPFDKSDSTHFATIVILPAQSYGDQILPETLLLATSFSGPANGHLDELIKIAGTGLRELFQHGEDFPPAASNSDTELKRFLRRHRHWDAFYSGMQFLTKSDIMRENDLRIKIQEFIDEENNVVKFMKSSPVTIRQHIQDHVRTLPGFDWTNKTSKKTVLDFAVLNWSLVLTGLIALFFVFAPLGWIIFNLAIFKIATWILLLFLAGALFLLLTIRRYEKQEKFVINRPDDSVVRKVSSSQRNHVINNMSVSGGLKEGKLRPLFFKVALKAVIMVRAYLSIPTVFTARWMAIDGGRRLVFISNFMNFSESYVRDFIDNKASARKINLLFGQGNGYPITEWITGKGALDDPNAFIHEVMTNHHITDFWYCPYQELSIENIKINRQIFLGLHAKSSNKQISEWLQLF